MECLGDLVENQLENDLKTPESVNHEVAQQCAHFYAFDYNMYDLLSYCTNEVISCLGTYDAQ